MMRLNRFLATCGADSRRKCDVLITEGLVKINDRVETQLGAQVDEKNDTITLRDQVIALPDTYRYYIINKPKGFVTTMADEKSRKTVVDLVPSKVRVFPVGRLDIDTTGLLLLTNDGDLAHKLTHPKFNVDKLYELRLDFELRSEDKEMIESGVPLDEGKTARCTISFPIAGKRNVVRMRMHQGWKRQIKRMFSKVGYTVLSLQRIGLSGLRLNGLKMGGCRELGAREVAHLKSLEN